MKTGSGNNIYNKNNVFPLLSDIPELSIQLYRLKREVEIQNNLFTFLTQQYEEAKIQEAKNTPTIQILDIAVTPQEKYKPMRVLIIVFAGIFSFLFSSIVVLIYKD